MPDPDANPFSMNWLKQHGPIALIRLIALLPLSWARNLGRVAGSLAWLSQSSASQIAQKNLKLCLPEVPVQQRQALAKNSVIETSKTFCELSAVWLWPDKKVAPLIKKVTGFELLQQGQDEGNGTIVITPHLGNWEILGYQLARFDALTCMYLKPDNPALDALMIEGRGNRGISLASADRSGVATVLKRLKNNGLVGILPDQVPIEGGGQFAPFFGESAYTMKLVATLCARTQCRVVIAWAKRVEGGFEIVLKPTRPGIGDPDIAQSLAAMNASVEDAVRELPEQYQWAYKRFKKRADGQRKFYQSIEL